MNNADYKITWIGLIEIKDRKVLMTREKGSSIFQLPGGSKENNESDMQTLTREIKEELGVEIRDVLPYEDFILPGRLEGVYIRFIIYKADIVGDIAIGEDIEEYMWVNSSYEKVGIDIGNPTKLVLFPRLLKENIIE